MNSEYGQDDLHFNKSKPLTARNEKEELVFDKSELKHKTIDVDNDSDEKVVKIPDNDPVLKADEEVNHVLRASQRLEEVA